MKHLLFLLLLLPCWVGASSPAAGIDDPFPVILEQGADRTDISRNLSFYKDASGSLTIEEAIARWNALGSDSRPDEAYNFGFTESVYWFHSRVENRSSTDYRWVIEGLYPIIDEMTLFIVRADGSVERQIAGDAVPFHLRARDHHNLNYELRLPQGEAVDLFFRVKTSGAIQMRTLLWSNDGFAAADHQERFLLGLYYGLLSCMLIFNLLIFMSFRDTNYLWYVSYILFYGLLQFNLNGLAFEHLWPESPWWNNRAVAVLIAVGMFCVLGFSRSFLVLKENAPRLDRMFKIQMGIYVLAAVAPLMYPVYGPVIRLNTFLATISIGFVIFAGGLCLYHRFRPARYFMIAWSALLLGMLLYTLKTFSVVPANFVTEFAIQIGSAFEVILLSIALADRIRHINMKTQQLQREMNAELESRVAERTSELEVANQRLKELSATDGLTGVFNRRFFDRRLEEEAARCQRQGALALLMIDVDHFKVFNDRLGHQAGDECLRQIADLLVATVQREADMVARYGGEEFAIILPLTDMEGACAIADRLRSNVENKLAFEWEGAKIPVTISVGVSAVPGGSVVSPDDLVAAADEALYHSKEHGRNRVSAQSVNDLRRPEATA